MRAGGAAWPRLCCGQCLIASPVRVPICAYVWVCCTVCACLSVCLSFLARRTSKCLTKHGFSVECAEDGVQAFEMLDTIRERIRAGDRSAHPIDLILLDLVMPRMDGKMVLSRLKDDPEVRGQLACWGSCPFFVCVPGNSPVALTSRARVFRVRADWHPAVPGTLYDVFASATVAGDSRDRHDVQRGGGDERGNAGFGRRGLPPEAPDGQRAAHAHQQGPCQRLCALARWTCIDSA